MSDATKVPTPLGFACSKTRTVYWTDAATHGACPHCFPIYTLPETLILATQRAESARVLTCVYCGHAYPQDAPAHGSTVLTEHITVCPKHPMRAAVEQRDRLRRALAAIVGASSAEDLALLEAGVRMESGGRADEDVAMVLNAIHALRDTVPTPTEVPRNV